MSDAARKTAIRQRGVVKSQVTRFKTFLTNFPPDGNITQLKERKNHLRESLNTFENIQSAIEGFSKPDEQEEDECERASFENEYFELQAMAQELISRLEPASMQAASTAVFPATSTATINNLPINREPLSNVRLPTINLPKFNGRYEDWLGFYDTFRSIIHDDDRISNVQKLHYLRSCLESEAAQVIQALETSDNNYGVAWTLLKERYDNKRIIVQSHIRQLFDLPNISKESAANVRSLLDNTLKHVRALEALGQPINSWGAMLVHLITTKLDRNTHREWERSISGTVLPSIDSFWEFLRNRCHVLENISPEVSSYEKKHVKVQSRDPRQFQIRTQQVCVGTQYKVNCKLCKEQHSLQHCERYAALSHNERTDFVKKNGLCFNCLGSNHLISACHSSNCRKCNKKHHTSLHFTETNQIVQEQNVNSASRNVTSLQATVPSQVLLSTASIMISDKQNQLHPCKLLLDSGSQSNFITESLAKRLGLHMKRIDVPVSGFNAVLTHLKHSVTTTIQSSSGQYVKELKFLVIPKITEYLPAEQVDRKVFKIPKNIVLADPQFHKPSEIDVLIGAEVFYSLLCVGQIVLNDQGTVLQKTRLGWVVAGRASTNTNTKYSSCHLVTGGLDDQIRRFWELEELPQTKHLSPEENSCEMHFKKNTCRDDTGRYQVRLPFKEHRNQLGHSYDTALRRFKNLEKRLSQDLNLKAEYCKFLREYQSSGHMSEVNIDDKANNYYMPHHAVLKATSATTKLRVVFDASAKSSTGISLNDILMVGPKVQEDLYPIIVRFRSHAYVLSADIEKMYRQIKIHQDDASCQRILWRENSDEPVKIFELNTVTYGTASASFLATRCLLQLADDEAAIFPNATEVLKHDFYVDDLLTGTNDIESALKLRNELIPLLQRGGFNLRQWLSNDKRLLASLPQSESKQRICLDESSAQKTLGIYWDPTQDVITYIIKTLTNGTRVTKRTILSQIASLFDPLGLLSPVLVRAKIIMQQLWLNKYEWDESLPLEIFTIWQEYKEQLPLLNDMSFPRQITLVHAVNVQLHGFCDASESAYGACLYLRSSDEKNNTLIRLICSKTRVAPVKKQSIPRLELCAAVLLSRLISTTKESLKMTFNAEYLWTDSSIVLQWINSAPHRLKTFVANRISELQSLTNIESWRHVPSHYNPADAASRGQSALDFLSNNLWCVGPHWLQNTEDNWPVLKLAQTEIPEQRSIIVLSNTAYSLDIVSRFSSIYKLKCVVAWCIRFKHNTSKGDKRIGPLSEQEMQFAMQKIIRITQEKAFGQELKQLTDKKPLHRKSKILPLNPFIDDCGLLRVGGRLQRADINYYAKHPILLPKCHLAELIIRAAHIDNMHAGVQATLYATRQNYWIIDGRNYVRKLVRQCIKCFRAKPSIPEYIMGQLPEGRIKFSRPFENTGIDFCGPFFTKEKKYRNRGKIKTYVAVFVCFATKAVHIEVISDLSTDTFLAGLRRFFARRGTPANIYTDNATNFVGAKNQLQELYDLFHSDSHNRQVQHYLNIHDIKWNFIPPRSPHFGGIWEAAVKIFKHHLKRTLGDGLLAFEEFNTFAIEIEAIMNSRPLTPLSSDPNDLTALCPSHFLIGDFMRSIPEHDFRGVTPNRLSCWEHIQQMKQHFWNRWYKEYINELNQRSKWFSGNSCNIQPGVLVLLKEDNLPSLKWALGRVTEVHSGPDGVVRVVTVKTIDGLYKRAVKKIAPLPLENHN